MNDWIGFWIGCGLGAGGFFIMGGIIMLGDSITSCLRNISVNVSIVEDEEGEDDEM